MSSAEFTLAAGTASGVAKDTELAEKIKFNPTKAAKNPKRLPISIFIEADLCEF
jgi:hypothetical protein